MKKSLRNHKVFGVQIAYVLDCIIIYDQDGNEVENATDKEKVSYFFSMFEQEYNYPHNKRIYPNIQERIAEYLKGLPSCISVAFSYADISNIGKSWGYCQTERKEAQFIENWFSVIALRLIQLKQYFEI